MASLQPPLHRWTRFARFASVLASAYLVIASSAMAEDNQEQDASPPSAQRILQECFAHRFDNDLVESIRIVQTDRAGAKRSSRIELAQKYISGRLHTLVNFIEPFDLYGSRLLIIEVDDRSDDHFMYLKSRRNTRRIRARRRDSFMGTDFSLEDLEKRHVSDFEIQSMKLDDHDGEKVYRIEVKPLYDSSYDRLEYLVAESDSSCVAINYFESNTSFPVKEMVIPRKTIELLNGIPIGRHAFVRNRRRHSETHIYLDTVVVDPELKDHLFTQGALEAGSKIPGL